MSQPDILVTQLLTSASNFSKTVIQNSYLQNRLGNVLVGRRL